MTTSSTTPHTHMTRSREMSLLQEDLARARLTERLAEAEASRQSRDARARRVQVRVSRARDAVPVPPRATRVASRARLLIGFGRAAGTR
jgi:hypothetical protein